MARVVKTENLVIQTYKTVGGQYCIQVYAWTPEMINYAIELGAEVAGGYCYFNTEQDRTAFLLKVK